LTRPLRITLTPSFVVTVSVSNPFLNDLRRETVPTHQVVDLLGRFPFLYGRSGVVCVAVVCALGWGQAAALEYLQTEQGSLLLLSPASGISVMAIVACS